MALLCRHIRYETRKTFLLSRVTAAHFSWTKPENVGVSTELNVLDFLRENPRKCLSADKEDAQTMRCIKIVLPMVEAAEQ